MRPYEARRFSELAAGRPVRIVTDGKTYASEEIPPLTKADLETAVSEIRGAAKNISESLGAVVTGQKEITEALYQPVEPVMEKGRVVGARRRRV